MYITQNIIKKSSLNTNLSKLDQTEINASQDLKQDQDSRVPTI